MSVNLRGSAILAECVKGILPLIHELEAHGTHGLEGHVTADCR